MDETRTVAARSTRERHIEWVRNSGMAVLLLLLVGMVFVIPALVNAGATWRFTTDVVLTLMLVSGIIAVAEHRRLAATLAVLSVIVIVVRWAEWFTPIGGLPSIRIVSTLSALLVLASAVAINVFASGHSIGDRVFGAIVLYLLLGLIWAVAYYEIAKSIPDAFAGHASVDGGLPDWVYFSFVTLTTVGYGDITPVARGARSLAMLEALVGQLYPAIIIARLVSLQGSSE